MKNALMALLVIDLLLIFGAGVRLISAPIKEPSRYVAPARYTPPDANTAAPADAAAIGDPAAAATPAPMLGQGAMTPSTGDLPPGMEGVIGGNRTTYEVDPNAILDGQKEGLEDAKDKLRILPGGGGRK